MVKLEDVIDNKLNVLFCGMAAGNKSANEGIYYADPRNKFWSILNKLNFTGNNIMPNEFKKLIFSQVGLTDLVKEQAGSDKLVKVSERDRDILMKKIKKYCPRVLAFNGKKPAKAFYKKSSVNYGIYNKKIGHTTIFILPSTSAAANRYWDEKYWRDLKKYIDENS